ncbi:MAG: GNAT family N-acetyltransferase [Chthoniobacterales bacterium]
MGPNRKTSDKPRYYEGSDVINVRSATPADAAEIASLCAELGYPRSKEESERRLELIADASDLLLVAAAESTGQLMGFIQAKRVCIIEVGVRVEILGLVVAEKFLRGGIGRHLIAEVERWARASGVEAVWCEVTPNEWKAMSFIQPWVIGQSKRRLFMKSDCLDKHSCA